MSTFESKVVNEQRHGCLEADSTESYLISSMSVISILYQEISVTEKGSNCEMSLLILGGKREEIISNHLSMWKDFNNAVSEATKAIILIVRRHC